MKVIIASTNNTKIESTRRSFEQAFPNETIDFEGVVVDSGVKDQPIGDDETITGAKNRVMDAQQRMPGADYYVGIESGAAHTQNGTEIFSWAAIRNARNLEGVGRSGSFLIPEAVGKHIADGKDLTEAVWLEYGLADIGKTTGLVGILTNGIIDRIEYERTAVVFALIPFISK